MHSPWNDLIRYLIGGVVVFFISACGPRPPVLDEDLQELTIEVPDHFRSIIPPDDNQITPAKINLGKRLFFDPILSQDLSISCADCHPAASGFSDPNRYSLGVGGAVGSRQAMPIMNLAYAKNLFWDGRVSSLEEQVIDPIVNPIEFATDTTTVLSRLREDPYYSVEIRRVFDTDEIRFVHLKKAIATFERSMVSYGSKYDQYLETQDTSIFTASERRGFDLYFTEEIGAKHAECFHCHGGFNLDEVQGLFRNNGLDEFYEDLGRANVTQNTKDIGKFRVPSLRNIEFTAPYMHDGRFETLEEVLDHYADGGAPNVNRDPLLVNIQLNEQDKQDIIAFLKTFSDQGFLTNPAFQE